MQLLQMLLLHDKVWLPCNSFGYSPHQLISPESQPQTRKETDLPIELADFKKRPSTSVWPASEGVYTHRRLKREMKKLTQSKRSNWGILKWHEPRLWKVIWKLSFAIRQRESRLYKYTVGYPQHSRWNDQEKSALLLDLLADMLKTIIFFKYMPKPASQDPRLHLDWSAGSTGRTSSVMFEPPNSKCFKQDSVLFLEKGF